MSEEKEDFFMNTNNSTAIEPNIKLFGSTKVLAAASIFVALSIVLGKFCAINIGDSIRIGFGGLPIQMAGMFFGPVIGGAVGLVADLVGCLLRGYSINPIITVGSTCIGLVSGLMFHNVLKGIKPVIPKIAISAVCAHIVGSMIITSFGLYVYYHTPMKTLFMRVPIYLLTSAAETVIISALMSSKAFMRELEKVRR